MSSLVAVAETSSRHSQHLLTHSSPIMGVPKLTATYNKQNIKEWIITLTFHRFSKLSGNPGQVKHLLFIKYLILRYFAHLPYVQKLRNKLAFFWKNSRFFSGLKLKIFLPGKIKCKQKNKAQWGTSALRSHSVLLLIFMLWNS